MGQGMTNEAVGHMEQWRAAVTANINQLNIKVGMLLKRLGVFFSLVSPFVMLPKSTKEGSCHGGITNLPYILL